MKVLFDTSSYYTGRGGACLVVEPSSKDENEIEAVSFRRDLRTTVLALPDVVSLGDQRSKWMQLEVDPNLAVDLAARADFIDALIDVIAGSGARFAPLLLVDWLTWPYRDRHPVRARDELLSYGPDQVRFDRLQSLRLPSLARWLDGREKVRDRSAFAAFHALDAASQALLRLAVRDTEVWASGPCSDGCHPSWVAAITPPLVADDWLTVLKNPYANNSIGFTRGPALARLNQAAGEFLGD